MLQIPYKFAVPWASSAGPPYVTPVIPIASAGTPNGATQQQGYPPVTGTAPEAGGIPPAMADWNGAMYYTTAWLQYIQAGAPIGYDAIFSAAIGGYPPGAIINNGLSTNAGVFWLNNSGTNNITNPDLGGAGWVQWPFPPPPPTSIRVIGTTGAVSNVTNLTMNDTTVTGGGGLATVTPIPQLFVGQQIGGSNVSNVAAVVFSGVATVSQYAPGGALVNIPGSNLVVRSNAGLYGQIGNVSTLNFHFTTPATNESGLNVIISDEGFIGGSQWAGITIPGLQILRSNAALPINAPCTILDFEGAVTVAQDPFLPQYYKVTIGGGGGGIPAPGAVGSYRTCLVTNFANFSGVAGSPVPGTVTGALQEYQGFDAFESPPLTHFPVGGPIPGTWQCVGPTTDPIGGGNQGLAAIGDPPLSQPDITHWMQTTWATWVRIA